MRINVAATVMVGIAGLVFAAACNKPEPPPPPTPSAAPLAKAPSNSQMPMGSGELPPGHPPIDGGQSAQGTPPNDGIHGGMGGGMGGQDGASNPSGMRAMPKSDGPRKLLDEPVTQFAGLTLTPPESWKGFDPGSSPMGPVAAFVLPKGEGDEQDTSARLTHFPGMKNIPIEMNLDRWYAQVRQPDGKPTKEVAQLETFDVDTVHVTLVDMPGTIDGVPGQRLIAAAIEHPQGPHFLKVAGPDATVEKWRDSVIEYLKSAKITP